MYLSTDSANANAWPLPQGFFWEFRFPVKSSTIQTSANLQGHVQMFDGNDSPVLNPSAPLYVFGAGSPPAVIHDRPSTVASEFLPGTSTRSAFGIISSGQVVVNEQGGTIRFRRGTSSGNYSAKGSVTVPPGSNAWNIWTDWDEPGFADVQPGKKYFWQFGFDPDPAGGGTVWGQEQSFTGLWATKCQGRAVTVALGLGQLPTAGDDVILGTPGADDIQGGGGNDTICSGAGADKINGGAGNDTVDAGGGSDLVTAGVGNDVLFGGADKDTVSYADASGGVTVSLGATGDQATGGGGTDRLSGFERVTGGDGADKLTGNGAANRLSGGKGDDRLIGGTGSDYCNGGAGTDSGKSCETKVKIP
jgi:Ca2+-binding RTX toxin-like protein